MVSLARLGGVQRGIGLGVELGAPIGQSGERADPARERDRREVFDAQGRLKRLGQQPARDKLGALEIGMPRSRTFVPDPLPWIERMSEHARMIDLTTPDERAFLIGLDDPRDGRWPVERSLAELAALAETAGATVVGRGSQRRPEPDPVWYFGKGRAAELLDEKAATDFNVLIVDDELAPNQLRSLEKLLDCKVLDRSALIIDIFARHAKTKEGRLQVELAALEYHLPRLTRMWTHLSRTGGGIGTRGPGESQLETDRRLIREKIKKVRAELDDVTSHRATAARRRERKEVASVALVGYTNAGKSTLLNALADADLYAADMLFATLDPTSRQVGLPGGQQIVMTDTVGFINKLPHDLVDAFRATLEEVMRADLLIEVVDAADPDFLGQQVAVQSVLDELGAGDKPRITVFNKIDLLAADAETAPSSDRAVFVSAVSGVGLNALRERIADALRGAMVAVDAVVPYERGELVARARTSGDVEERYEERGVRVSGQLPQSIAAELTAAGRPARRRDDAPH
ncbi:GTPase HflX [soil metagenome]